MTILPPRRRAEAANAKAARRGLIALERASFELRWPMFDRTRYATAAPIWCTLREIPAAALRGLISAELSLRRIAALESAVLRSNQRGSISTELPLRRIAALESAVLRSNQRGLISAELSLRPIAALESAAWPSAALLPLILNRVAGRSATLPLVALLLCLPLIAALRVSPPPMLLIIITLRNLLDWKIAGRCK